MVLTQRALLLLLHVDDVMFPYHYGSHATENGRILGVKRFRFHTTMVLTQQAREAQYLLPYVKFPYHYGSHATPIVNRPVELISQLFPYHYGSHATWNTWVSNKTISVCFHTTMVLTQPNQEHAPRRR